jgi:hypothetical protein
MSTIIVKPSKIQQNRSAYQRLFLTLDGADWTDESVFSISGVAGVTLVGQIVDSESQAYVIVKTTGSAAGTLTVSDGTFSGTTTVGPIAPTYRRWFPGLDRRRREPFGE